MSSRKDENKFKQHLRIILNLANSVRDGERQTIGLVTIAKNGGTLIVTGFRNLGIPFKFLGTVGIYTFQQLRRALKAIGNANYHESPDFFVAKVNLNQKKKQK